MATATSNFPPADRECCAPSLCRCQCIPVVRRSKTCRRYIPAFLAPLTGSRVNTTGSVTNRPASSGQHCRTGNSPRLTSSPRSRRRLMKSRKSLIRQVPDQPGPPSGRTWSSFASLREIEGEDHELRRHIHLTYQHVAIHLQPHWREVQDPFDPTLHCLGCHSLCSIRRYRYYDYVHSAVTDEITENSL